MIPKSAAIRSLLGALLIGSPAGLHPLRALATPTNAALKTYTNGAFGFSITYPASWKVKPSQSFALEALAPDSNALLTAVAFKGHVTRSQIVKNELQILSSLGSFARPPRTSTMHIHDRTFVLSRATIKQRDGTVLAALVLDTTRRGAIYNFNALIIAGNPGYKRETAQIVNAFNSIKIR